MKISSRSRKGFAAAMALIVALVGGVLCAFLIEMSYSFFSRTNRQRMFYGDHVTVTDYIQAVKGRIVDRNSNNPDKKVLHGKNMTSGDLPINHVSDLVLEYMEGGENLYSRDYDVGSWGMGKQVVKVKVYDVAYYYSQLQDSVKNDPAQMMELPPPINMLAGQASSTSVTPVGDTNVGDKGENKFPQGDVPWEKFGAYMIRVELYDAQGRSSRRGGILPVRVAEESFFQVISLDL